MNPRSAPQWVVVSGYPLWPSPYFAQLERHASAGLNLRFVPDLHAVDGLCGPGVVNLHRLKRLYQDPTGRRTVEEATVALSHLRRLRQRGWRIAWTVHNLLPIDGQPAGEADYLFADGVLGLADVVICHTRADATYLTTATCAQVVVAGWSGPPACATTPVLAQVVALSESIAANDVSVLVLGNLTHYKGLPEVIDAFAAHTTTSHLFLVGPCRDAGLDAALRVRAANAEGRVHLVEGRVNPPDVRMLYSAASAALCPYRVDGQWEFFRRVLHPSSVGTASALGVPVIAPALPAIAEITTNRPRLLYNPGSGPGEALAAVENHSWPHSGRINEWDADRQWRNMGDVYVALVRKLLADQQSRR